MTFQNKTKLSSFLTSILYVFGLWPKTSLEKAYKIYSYVFHFATSFLFCLFMLINLLANINNVEEIIESLYPTLMVLAYIFKLLNYYKYGANIVNTSNALFNLQLYNQSDDKIFHCRLSALTKLTCFLYCVSNFAWCVACSKTFLGSSTELPVPSQYLLNWRDNKLYFYVIFLHQSFGGFIMVNCNIGMDCLAYYFLCMVATHFEILHTHIQSLGIGIGSNVVERGHPIRKAQESVGLSIKLCIEEHQKVLELVKDIESYFSIQFVSQIFLSGAILSGGTYQLTIMSPSESLFQFTYLLAFMLTVTTQTFLYTYFGNGIETTSDLVTNSVYSSCWYVIPAASRKDLILIMERAKQRCAITAGKLFSLNLALFTDIINLAYRLYTLLKGASF